MREGNERYMRDEGKREKPEDGGWVKDRVIFLFFYTLHVKNNLPTCFALVCYHCAFDSTYIYC